MTAYAERRTQVFQPDSRVILLDQLRAPAGYGLEAAVATTFTLQLGAALVPPLAFASQQMRDAVDPIAVLEAVRSTADRIDVFCQAGRMSGTASGIRPHGLP